jgi:hypothetical protein
MSFHNEIKNLGRVQSRKILDEKIYLMAYSNFYENVTFLRNLVKFCKFISKRIMDRNVAA